MEWNRKADGHQPFEHASKCTGPILSKDWKLMKCWAWMLAKRCVVNVMLTVWCVCSLCTLVLWSSFWSSLWSSLWSFLWYTLAMWSGETKRDSKTRHGGRSRCWQRHQALAMGWIVGLGLETPFVLRVIEDAVFRSKMHQARFILKTACRKLGSSHLQYMLHPCMDVWHLSNQVHQMLLC